MPHPARMNPAGNRHAAVEAVDLCMRYGSTTAVDRLSFSIAGPSTVGLLGPNGAGKSTVMRILAGFRIPSSGRAAIAGHDLLTARRRAQAVTGYLPETAGGLGRLTALELLTGCCDARGIRGPAARRAIGRVGEDLDLAPVLGKRLAALSKGWRQRVWLAQALVHDPRVLILDEPTDGLDPIQKRGIRRLIKQLAATRVIMLSTHILEEAETVCERALIIDHGRLLADARVEDLVDEKGRLAPLFHALTAAPGSARAVR